MEEGMELRIIEIRPTHPEGFGDHEFEYEFGTDLFKCWKCRRYEIVVRNSSTGTISPCPGREIDPDA